MAVLFFSGDKVAFFGGINDTGDFSEFTEVIAPFNSSDTVEIEIPDQYIQLDGSFDPNEVQFTRITVVSGGARYDFAVDAGSKIKETGGGEVKEGGDTFFSTNDTVGPPSSGPFTGLDTEKMVFSTDSTFSTGQSTTIDRTQHTDNNLDGDTDDAGETADAQFNANRATTITCYAPGTQIETQTGERPVEDLEPGDLVLTRDNGLQAILWCRKGPQALDGLERHARPILIKAGVLGPAIPKRDLIVSPQHRIFVGGGQQLATYFQSEAFVPAKALTMLPGVRHIMGRHQMTWFHFACARHEVVRANGCWSESLLLGPMSQRSLSQRDRWQLATALSSPIGRDYMNGPAARPCLKVAEARRMLLQSKFKLHIAV